MILRTQPPPNFLPQFRPETLLALGAGAVEFVVAFQLLAHLHRAGARDVHGGIIFKSFWRWFGYAPIERDLLGGKYAPIQRDLGGEYDQPSKGTVELMNPGSARAGISHAGYLMGAAVGQGAWPW